MAKKKKYNIVKFKSSDNGIFREGTNKADKAVVIGHDSSFYGKKGNDYIIIKKGSGLGAHGGPGKDTIIINKTAESATVDGELGNDTITIKGGKNNTAHGGSGADKITIKGGYSNCANGDSGNDKIYTTAKHVAVSNKILANYF